MLHSKTSFKAFESRMILKYFQKIVSITKFSTGSPMTDFNDLITSCRESGRRDKILPLLKERYIDEELHNVSLLTSAFLDNKLDIENLKFIAKSIDYSSFTLVLHELIDSVESDEAVLAANKAIEVFGKQKYDVLRSLADFASEKRNTFLENFLLNLIEEVAPYAEMPSWVSDFGLREPPEIKYYHRIDYNIEANLTPEEIIEKLKELGIEFEDDAKAAEQLKQRLSISSLQGESGPTQHADSSKIITELFNKKLTEELYFNRDLFRWFGPDNPTYSRSERMFESYLFDYDDDMDIIKDWYNGACNFCHLKIRKKVHSLRMPMPSGGWFGCYCSFNCLRNAIYSMEYEEKQYYVMIHLMTNILEDEIKTIGIQDRENWEVAGEC